MINIATFDIIPKDDWYPIWFDLPDTDSPYNEKFDLLGLGSRFFILNFGTLFLAWKAKYTKSYARLKRPWAMTYYGILTSDSCTLPTLKLYLEYC